MKSDKRIAALFTTCLLAPLLMACGTGATSDGAASPTLTLTLQRYHTPSATQAGEASPAAVEPTAPPLPTSTPLLHTVVQNDTLLDIAARYNVPLEELLAANPSIDPRFLAVDTVLIIPQGEASGGSAALPTPTPLPLAARGPACYSISSGGLWCFLVVENGQEYPIENLTGLVYLYAQDGELLVSQEASAPLNVINPQQDMPLTAFFESPPPAWSLARAQIVTALAVNSPDRYLDAELQEVVVSIADEGLSASVAGEVRLSASDRTANLIWVAAIAFSEGGEVVGLRRWESTTPLSGDEVLAFNLQLFSLGPPIDQVSLLLEARP